MAVTVLCNYARVDPTALAEAVGAAWLEDRMEPLERSAPTRANAEARSGVEEPSFSISQQLENALIGTYYSRELDATYRILREGDVLVLDMNGVFTVPVTGGPRARSGPTGLR